MSGNSTNTTSYSILGTVDTRYFPALWAGSTFAFLAFVTVTYHVIRSYTSLRLASALSLGSVFVLTVTNLLQTYFQVPAVIFLHAILFGLFTLIFAEILIAVLLSIGSTFRFPGPARTSFFWIVVAFGVAFFLTGITLIVICLLLKPTATNFITLVTFVLVTGVFAEFTAAIYTFKALVWKPNRPDLPQSEAFAVGVWYLGLIIPVRIIYVAFYVNALAHFPNGSIFSQQHEIVDLVLRTIYGLAYGLPPSRRGIRFIRLKLSAKRTNDCCRNLDSEGNKVELEPGPLPLEDSESQVD